MMTADVLMSALLAYIAVPPPALLSGLNQTELSRNVKIWRSKHVEISSESETNIAEFVSV